MGASPDFPHPPLLRSFIRSRGSCFIRRFSLLSSLAEPAAAAADRKKNAGPCVLFLLLGGCFFFFFFSMPAYYYNYVPFSSSGEHSNPTEASPAEGAANGPARDYRAHTHIHIHARKHGTHCGTGSRVDATQCKWGNKYVGNIYTNTRSHTQGVGYYFLLSVTFQRKHTAASGTMRHIGCTFPLFHHKAPHHAIIIVVRPAHTTPSVTEPARCGEGQQKIFKKKNPQYTHKKKQVGMLEWNTPGALSHKQSMVVFFFR